MLRLANATNLLGVNRLVEGKSFHGKLQDDGSLLLTDEPLPPSQDVPTMRVVRVDHEKRSVTIERL